MLRKVSRRIREASFTLLEGATYSNRFAEYMGSLGERLDDGVGPFQPENLTIHAVPQSGLQVPVLSTTILHLGTCRLRNLRLHGMGLHWEPSFLKNLSLTSLSITRIPIGWVRPTVIQVIRVLESLPDLQSLCLDSIDSSSNIPDSVVHLDHLSHLELDCTPTDWSLLLSHLVYPPLMVMRLASADTSTPKLDVLAGLSSVAQLRGQTLTTKLPIRCITVSRFSSGSVMLRTWNKRGTRSGPPSLDPTLQLEISLKSWRTDRSVHKLLIRICGKLALGSLEGLHLEGVLVEAAPLLETFGKLKSLDTIRFVRLGLRGHSVVEALSAGIVRDTGEKAMTQVVSDCRLKFAALRNLVCEYWINKKEMKRSWQGLANCLKERRRRGAGIQTLFLRSSRLSCREIQSLKSKGVAQETCMSEVTVISRKPRRRNPTRR